MQKQTLSEALSRGSPYILSIVRIVVALLFFEHGLSKMFGFPQPMPAPALQVRQQIEVDCAAA